MADEVTCNVCGGNEFHNEGGFYYCNECQTQTQEMREQVFDFIEDTVNIRQTVRVIKSKSSEKNTGKLTSWETYNYIILGLVRELMDLGADNEFKDITYRLWVRYLSKLEVISKKSIKTPKVAAIYRKRDAELIFHRNFTRKRNRSVSASSAISSDVDSRSVSREMSKQKRLMIKAEYEKHTSTQSSSTSLHNQTLSSLSSDDETSSVEGQVIFTKVAKKELLKHMSAAHLKKHINDINNEMKCHRNNKYFLSYTYRNGPYILTKSKLYSILYIASLLTQEPFQLSDIIRFCREGFLSFIDYRHFFQDVLEKNIDQSVFEASGRCIFSHELIRKNAIDIFRLLDLDSCNFTPNLVELCKRYCKELNLPDKIYKIAGNLINKTKPKMPITDSTASLPNYEGRAIGFIIYVLKVLFSFDDVTEYEFTKFASLLNEQSESKTMFVWSDWFNYIEYRKVILRNKHFPTKFQLDPNSITGSDIFATFIRQKNQGKSASDKQILSMKVLEKLLGDLEIFQDAEDENIEFKHSFTPFRSHIESIQNAKNVRVLGQKINNDALKDFSTYEIEFVINPLLYLKLINAEKSEIKFSPANLNQRYIKLKKTLNYSRRNESAVQRCWEEIFQENKSDILHFNILMDKILDKHIKNVVTQRRIEPAEPQIKFVPEKHRETIKKSVGRDSKGRFCKLESEDKKMKFKSKKRREWFVSSWTENPRLSEHKYNISLARQIMKEEEAKQLKNSSKKSKKNDNHGTFYIPRFEYWVNLPANMLSMNVEQWKEFENTLPKNFQWLLAECARITEQSTKNLFFEFVCVEIYISYIYLENLPTLFERYDNYKELQDLMKLVNEIW